jgi:hypothetical protein
VAYGDAWEQETFERWHRWQEARWFRELLDARKDPDDRLDEVGWDIFYCATARGMDEYEAATIAMDGTYRQRLRVREDMFRRHGDILKRRYAELHPDAPALNDFETGAHEQLEFWTTKLAAPSFIYFIQHGENGPVKIGLSIEPVKRIRKLQTGNPRDLFLRHVVPGDLSVEQQLHDRFEPARIRGEWFGLEYLPVIVAFAGGLANQMIESYDGSGQPPKLIRGQVRTRTELDRIRRDIERLRIAGHDIRTIAELTWLDVSEVQDQLLEMHGLGIYDVVPRWTIPQPYRMFKRRRSKRPSAEMETRSGRRPS